MTDFPINSTTASGQIDPAVAMDADGDFVVTWSSFLQDGDSDGIFAQRYNAAGVAQGGEFRVNTTTTSQQSHPAIAMDTDGDFVVSWISPDGNDFGIYAQRYNAIGAAQGGEFRVNTTTFSGQRDPSIAMDADGDFVVTWRSNLQDGSNDGVYAQRYNASGTAQGSEFRVNTTTTGGQGFPSVAMDDDGNFVVAWMSPDASGYGIFAQRYNTLGVAQGNEFRVNVTTANTQGFPSIAMDADGDFVVTWQSSGQDGSGYGIYAQRYNSLGAAQGGEFRVNTRTLDIQRLPTVAMDADGDFVVTWQSSGQDGSDDGIFGQRYNAAGVPLGSEFRVNTTTASAQRSSSVAMDADGDFAAAWQSFGQDGVGWGIFAQIFGADGTPRPQLDLDASVAGTSFAITIPSGSAAVSIADADAIIAGAPTGLLTALTATIATRPDGAAETLSLSAAALSAANAAGITAAWDASSGVLTLSGTATRAQYEAALRGIQYANSDTTPTTGAREIAVRFSDGTGFSNTAISTVTVSAPANTAPSAVDDTVAGTEDGGALTGNLLANDTDAENSAGALTVTAGTLNGNHGTLAIAANGGFTYTPAAQALRAGQVVTDTFNYTVTDPGGLSDTGTLTVTVTGQNDAPVLSNPLADVERPEGAPVVFGLLPSNAFQDPDAGDTLTLSARLAGGAPLPGWLAFDPVQRSFSGTAPDGTTGALTIEVTASDGSGATVSDQFVLTLTPVEDAPRVGTAIGPQASPEDIVWSFQVPAGAFVEPDGQALGYVATLASGEALPAWLQFNAASQTFTGTPPANFNGQIGLRVTATDPGGLSAAQDFVLTVTPVNDAPALTGTVAPPAAGIENTPYILDNSILLLGWTDPELDALQVANLTPSAGTIEVTPSGWTLTPPAGFSGTITLTYQVVDGQGGSTPASLPIAFTGVNDAPAAGTPIGNQSVAEETAWTYTVPAAAFTDGDGDTLSYAATLANGDPLPAWLGFNAGTRTFTGTPPANFDGELSLRVTASDPAGASASQTFTLDVTPVNDAPTGAPTAGPVAATEDVPFTLTPAQLLAGFTDSDGDTLSVLAVSAERFAIVAGSGGTLTFTPQANFSGSTTIAYTVADGRGGTRDAVLAVEVAPVNDAPVVATEVAVPPPGLEDTPYTLTSALLLNGWSDPDGNPLAVVNLLASEGTLEVTATGWTLTPPAGFNGSIELTYQVVDGQGGSTAARLPIGFSSVNDPPAPGTAIGTQTVAEDTAWSFTVPETAFTDQDGGPLVYGATLANGDPLPAWLGFNVATRTFSGTPPANFDGELSLRVTASEPAGASASQTFTLDVTPVNDAPVVAPAVPVPPPGTEDTPYALTSALLLAGWSDPDGDTLAVANISATNGTVQATTGGWTLTPAAGFSGVVEVAYEVVDGRGGVAPARLPVSFNGENDAPTAGAPISTQTVAEDTAWTYTVPVAAFTDGDGDTLSYAATLANGDLLPAWLGFNAATRTFTGTPPANFDGELSLRVTASDPAGASASQTFTLDVTPVNDAPVLAVAISDRAATEDAPFSFTLPAGTFADPDLVSGDALTLTATLESGAPLPAWLQFNAAAGAFSGTPGEADAGAISVRVTATDKAGASVSDVFAITVGGENDAPVLATPLADQAGAEDTAVDFTVPPGTFTDPDAGDTLTLGASLAGGGPLPAWLFFDSSTGRFTGTPPANFSGTVAVRVTATDGGGGSASDTFDLVLAPVNDVPVAAAVNLGTLAEEGSRVITAAELLAGVTDVDGPALAITGLVIQTGGGTLAANPGGTWTYTGAPDDSSQVAFTYSVADGAGGTASGTASLDLTAGDDAPVVSGPLTGAATEDGAAVALNPLANASDPDGDALQVTGLPASLPAGVTWDAVAGRLTLDPANAAYQALGAGQSTTVTVSYAVSDGTLSTPAEARWAVTGVNDAPIASLVQLGQVAEDTPRTITAAELLTGATDADTGAVLQVTEVAVISGGGTVVANGPGSWLYTPAPNDTSAVVFSYTVSDGREQAGGVATLDLTPANDAPVAAAVDLGAIAEEGSRVITAAELLAGVTDADGPAPTVTGLVIATGNGTLIANPDGTWTYTGAADDSSQVAFTYSVADGAGGTASGTASLDLLGGNDGPLVSGPVTGAATEDGVAVALNPLANASDPDGDALQVTGLPASLPAGVTWDAVARRLTLDPANAAYQTLRGGQTTQVEVAYQVSDGQTSTPGLARWTVTGVNDAPTAVALSANTVAENGAAGQVVGLLSATDADQGDTFTYALSGADAAFLEVVGSSLRLRAPADFETKPSYAVTVTATDAGGLSFAQALTVQVTDVPEGGGPGLIGTPASEALTGGAGNDTIIGNGGRDTLRGEGGDDEITYQTGSVIAGGTGRDTLVIPGGLTGPVRLNLGSSDQDEGNSTVSGFQDVNGSNATGPLRIRGGEEGGNRLLGGVGNDTIDGGSGRDTISGGGGADSLMGGSDDDLVLYQGNSTISGSSGTDTLLVTSGGAFNLNASNQDVSGLSRVSSFEAVDASGSTAAVRLAGKTAAERLAGGAGNDTIAGGGGLDTLLGGGGADLFVYTRTGSQGQIGDFVAGQDVIDLSAIDANGGQSGNGTFAWIGAGAFTGTAGQLRAVQQGGNTVLQGDTNGDRSADVTITLAGLVTLDPAKDLVL